MKMETISMNMRKRLILAHQHITKKTNPLDVCRDVCGIQAQFYHHALHSLTLRSCDKLPEDMKEEFVKTWTLRGTLHVITKEDRALFLSAMHRNYENRGHYFAQFFTPQEEAKLCSLILEEAKQGSVNRKAFANVMEEHGYPKDKINIACSGWGGLFSILSVEGKLVFEDITSRNFRACEKVAWIDGDKAREEIILRYFKAYGPSSIKDASYFLHWSQKEIMKVVEAHQLACYECEGLKVYDANGIDDVKRIPTVVFLGGFDPLMLGYEKHQNPFLPQRYMRSIFNMQGIVFAAILYKGEVCGKWKKDKKTMQIELFYDMDMNERVKIERAAFKYWKKQIERVVWL